VSHRPPNVPLPVIAGLFIASIALRPQILAIGPLLPIIRDDLGLPAAVAALLTTFPVLCMGLLAPVGPRLAARVGPRLAFAGCLALIAGVGLVRAISPGLPVLLLLTIVIGIGIGVAGPIPSMVVAGRVPWRPALGTGAYAAGIVTGSAVAAAVAVPLSGGEDWRRALLVISAVSCLAVVVWLFLVTPDARHPGVGAVRRPPLPWRSPTGWLLVALFGLQSVLFYGAIAWLPNLYVEHGWTVEEAGALVAWLNAIGLFTTIGIPLVADRIGGRRWQLVASAAVAVVSLVGIALAPDQLAYLWVSLLGLALGMVFPLVLTLPIDVADDPPTVGSVAALMLLGGYILSSLGPLALGIARDATGDFQTSLWLLVGVAVALTAGCLLLTPERLRRGIRRDPVLSSAA
jgi:CP family cyanate transporter-like MFS transporter